MEIFCKHDELVKIEDLKSKFNPKNPNEHSDDQINQIIKIFEKNGIRSCAVVSRRSGLLIKGHGRCLAAEKAGLKEFPVEYQDYESEAIEYQDMIADNAIQSWSYLNLGKINIDIQDLGPDLDIEALSIKDFTIEPMDRFIEKINSGNENAEWAQIEKDEIDNKFKEGSGYISVIWHFKTELERELYIKNNNLNIDIKKNDAQWIIYG